MLEKFTGKIGDVFHLGGKYTFLVGAGISMDPPANLSSARELSKILIEQCAPADEVKNLLSLDTLRYEIVVEQVQKFFDKSLNFMDYFDHATEPNAIHLFLAGTIISGHYVITTNFDYMLEHALEKILPKRERESIIPVITKEDYSKFENPAKIVRDKKYPVYKIHGSKKNIITAENTVDSLVTTMTALGKDREKGETFAIEPYKKPAVSNLMKNRILVVMGYSGSDDFDIGPVLHEITDLGTLIWVEHSTSAQTEILKVSSKKFSEIQDQDNLGKTERMLLEISEGGSFDVFMIKTNTAKFVSGIMCSSILPTNIDHSLLQPETETAVGTPEFKDWLMNTGIFKDITEYKRMQFAGELFDNLSRFNAAERCYMRGLNIVEKGDNDAARAYFLNNIGKVYSLRWDYDKAIEYYNKALKIDEQLGDLTGKARDLNNIGLIYYARDDYDKAIEYYNESLKIDEQLGDLKGKASCLLSIGFAYAAREDYDKAIEYYNESLKIDEQLGDLTGKAGCLSSIGTIYSFRGDYDKAIEYYNESLKIAEQLGDLRHKEAILINIGGFIYYARGDYDKALEYYKEALKIDEQLGDLPKKALSLWWIGIIYGKKKEKDLALEKLKQALKIYKQIGITNEVKAVQESIDNLENS